MPEFDENDPRDFEAGDTGDGELDWVSPDPEDSDAGTVAFLDQQEAEFAAGRERWNKLYGFDHDCHCSQDYTDGKLGQVTQCFMQLTSQALGRCAEATHEIKVFSAMLSEMLAVNNDLVKMMEDLGHEKELQEYFGEALEIEDEVLSQMELQFEDEGGTSEADSEDEETPEQ